MKPVDAIFLAAALLLAFRSGLLGEAGPATPPPVAAPSQEMQAAVKPIVDVVRDADPVLRRRMAGLSDAFATYIESGEIETTAQARQLHTEAVKVLGKGKPIGPAGLGVAFNQAAEPVLGLDAVRLDDKSRANAAAFFRAISWAWSQ